MQRARYSVVARGAGTGLSGGALPSRRRSAGAVEFDRILALDPLATARVQPSVRISRSPRLLHIMVFTTHRILLADRRRSEQRGGECRRRALPEVQADRHSILALEIVLMNGERLTIGSAALDAPTTVALLTGSKACSA
jgi:glycolate oxidase